MSEHDAPPNTVPPPAPADVRASPRLAFETRLADSADDLIAELDIESFERRRFAPGNEAQGIWEWLAVRHRLAELPARLRNIGRGDLADLLEFAHASRVPEPGPPAVPEPAAVPAPPAVPVRAAVPSRPARRRFTARAITAVVASTLLLALGTVATVIVLDRDDRPAEVAGTGPDPSSTPAASGPQSGPSGSPAPTVGFDPDGPGPLPPVTGSPPPGSTPSATPPRTSSPAPVPPEPPRPNAVDPPYDEVGPKDMLMNSVEGIDLAWLRHVADPENNFKARTGEVYTLNGTRLKKMGRTAPDYQTCRGAVGIDTGVTTVPFTNLAVDDYLCAYSKGIWVRIQVTAIPGGAEQRFRFNGWTWKNP
ncbi:hypothetical protein Val02_25290 [Virgisporangium aliadipatigenens]|uniref:Bacterial Death-like domain-containing protein n=1 Tax=Virgisporangium aliadipatigenens TaxID=741659 RepID=A0A8J4DQF2_9ACTN|nr:hypothetical protein [Virgisporangium aliadipatigenens]GIJ45643.1 hypothetical protein Val02_25290 [Virgisporangium aliadipatigenens]